MNKEAAGRKRGLRKNRLLDSTENREMMKNANSTTMGLRDGKREKGNRYKGA